MRKGFRSDLNRRGPFASGHPAPSGMALLSFAIIMVVSILAMPYVSLGAEADRGRDVVIEEGENLTEDSYWLGATVDFRGSSDREVTIVAGDAEVSGDIAGTLQLAVGQATVSGNVGNSLRVVGGNVELRGDVGGDVIVVGGRVRIPSSSTIGGDIIIAGGQLDLRGNVQGNVTGYTWKLVIAGTVEGSVDVNVSELEVRSTAQINGDLTYHTYLRPDIDDGADIRGTITDPPQFPWDSLLNPTGMFGPLLRLMWALLVGAVIVLIAPGVAQTMSTNAGGYLRSGIVGLIGLVALPIVSLVLLVTLIGVPIGLLLLTGFLIALYLSQIAVGLAIGRFVLPDSWHDGSRGFYLLAMTLGVLVVGLLKMIPVPWVAGIIGLIVTVWGLGAVLLLVTRIMASRPRVESS